MGEREAQHPAQKLAAQQAQQALAEPALVDVDGVFEGAVDQHGEQEQTAQEGEELELRIAAEMEAAEADRARKIGRLAAERLVDDLLGQIERGVVDRERSRGQRQQQDLLGQAELEQEAEGGARQLVARAAAEAGEPSAPRALGPRGRAVRCGRRGLPARVAVGVRTLRRALGRALRRALGRALGQALHRHALTVPSLATDLRIARRHAVRLASSCRGAAGRAGGEGDQEHYLGDRGSKSRAPAAAFGPLREGHGRAAPAAPATDPAGVRHKPLFRQTPVREALPSNSAKRANPRRLTEPSGRGRPRPLEEAEIAWT